MFRLILSKILLINNFSQTKEGNFMKKTSLLPIMVVLLLGLFTYEGHASDKATIQWWNFNYVPYYFGPGADRKGIGEEILDFYIKKLPQYNHTVKEEPIKRLYTEMSKTKKGAICSPVKTELPPNLKPGTIHTPPNLILPPPGIVVAKANLAKYFNNGKNVSIAELLKNEQITLGWLIGGTYAPGIATAIRPYENMKPVPSNLQLHAKLEGGFIKMLQKDRIHYYVSHSLTAEYRIQENKLQDKLEFLSVAEAQGVSNTYAFCSNTKLGNEVMKELIKITKSKEYTYFLAGLIKKYVPKSKVKEYLEKNNLYIKYKK